jgi:hypothetical protein
MPRLVDIPPSYPDERPALGRSRVAPKAEDTLTAEERQLLIDLVQATADVLGFVDPTPTCGAEIGDGSGFSPRGIRSLLDSCPLADGLLY